MLDEVGDSTPILRHPARTARSVVGSGNLRGRDGVVFGRLRENLIHELSAAEGVFDFLDGSAEGVEPNLAHPSDSEKSGSGNLGISFRGPLEHLSGLLDFIQKSFNKVTNVLHRLVLRFRFAWSYEKVVEIESRSGFDHVTDDFVASVSTLLSLQFF